MDLLQPIARGWGVANAAGRQAEPEGDFFRWCGKINSDSVTEEQAKSLKTS